MGFLKKLFGIKESNPEPSKNSGKSKDEKLIDLHFELNSKIKKSYKKRKKDKKYIEECIKYCKEDIELYEKKLRYMSFFKDNNTRIPAFQRLAIIYEKRKEYEKAIKICEKAIKFDMREKNKDNFEDRLEKLESKLNS